MTAQSDHDLWIVYYNRNRVRFLIVFLLLMASIIGGIVYNKIATDDAADKAYRQCQQRRDNLKRANAFYQGLAEIERHNLNDDRRTRDALVRIYERNIYVLPVC